MSSDKVIGVYNQEFTEQNLVDILEVLNKYRYEEEGEQQITKEMVLGKPELLQYIMKEWYEEGGHDPFEIWNADGWCDIDNYL